MEYSVDLNTQQFRLVLEVLCSLTSIKSKNYSNYNSNHKEATQTVRDHLNMMVKKQIGSRSIELKKQGIVGAIKIISSMLLHHSTISFDDKEILRIDDLPEGPAQEAAKLIGNLLINIIIAY